MSELAASQIYRQLPPRRGLDSRSYREDFMDGMPFDDRMERLTLGLRLSGLELVDPGFSPKEGLVTVNYGKLKVLNFMSDPTSVTIATAEIVREEKRGGKEPERLAYRLARLSEVPFELDEFRRDVGNINRHYIEGRIGEPPDNKTLAYFAGGGILLAGGAGFGSMLMMGNDFGDMWKTAVLLALSQVGIAGFIIPNIYNEMREGWAFRGYDGRLGEYAYNAEALAALQGVKSHIDRVGVQTELYPTLKQDDLTPNRFLQIWESEMNNKDGVLSTLFERRLSEGILVEPGSSDAVANMRKLLMIALEEEASNKRFKQEKEALIH